MMNEEETKYKRTIQCVSIDRKTNAFRLFIAFILFLRKTQAYWRRILMCEKSDDC